MRTTTLPGLRLALTSILTILLSQQALQAQVFLDFEATDSVTNNIRVANAGTTFTWQEGADGNGFLKGGAGTGAYVYDANGATAGVTSFAVSQSTPLQISFNLSGQATGGSFGVYIINAGTNTAFMGLLNLNLSGSNDAFRFASGTADISTAGIGTLTLGDHPNNTNFISNEGVGDIGTVPQGSPPFDSEVLFTYSINGSNQAVLTYTVNGTTSEHIVTSVAAFTDVEIGFRSAGAGAAMRIDNLAITTVPEPAGVALAGMAACFLALRRRRR